MLLDVVAQNLEIFALLELVEEVEDGVLHLLRVTITLHGNIGEVSHGSYGARLGVGHGSRDHGERAEDDKNSKNLSHASASFGALWTFLLITLYNSKQDMSSFWNKITKPIFVQAPLANVTDVAFREIIAKYGRPDVFFTEFVSADGLCSKGREVLLRDLRYTENQRPIVAQFFGANPEHIKKCAELAVELGFDGVDINMGCPDKAVLKQGAGAALIKNPKLAAEIIEAAMEGARSASSGQAGIPVSVKTRIGYNKIEIEEWVPMLLKTGIVALVLHLRTMKEMSKVPAHWEVLKRVV